jgi:hypothetical protein
MKTSFAAAALPHHRGKWLSAVKRRGRTMLQRTLSVVVFVALVLWTPVAFAQEKLVATYGEARTVLAFKIPEATVQKLLPQGWLPNPISAGPAKEANLVVTFMDWLVVMNPDGKPEKTYRSVGLGVPAKQNGTDVTVSMVVGGLSSPPGYAPGPYGNFAAAKSMITRTLRTGEDALSRAEESWQFEGESGDSIQLQLQFTRGIAARSKLEAKVHSALKPEFYRIYRIEQAADVVRSVADGTDRVQTYLFKASGPLLSQLFDGSEQLVSITSMPWFSRQAFLPSTHAD